MEEGQKEKEEEEKKRKRRRNREASGYNEHLMIITLLDTDHSETRRIIRFDLIGG